MDFQQKCSNRELFGADQINNYYFQAKLNEMPFFQQQPSGSILSKCKSLRSLDARNMLVPNVVGISTSPKHEQLRPRQQGRMASPRAGGEKPTLARVKSVDQFHKDYAVGAIENIVELYKKENDNLRQQNLFLLNEVKKKQKNEQVLRTYIEQLRKQIRNLERKQSVSPLAADCCKYHPCSTARSSKYSSSLGQVLEPVSLKCAYIVDDCETMTTHNELDWLALRLNQLMQQCSKETNKRKRSTIREKMAATAQKMKSIKKQLNISE